MFDQDLKSLKKKFTDPEDKERIKGWEKDIEKCLLMKSLSEHDGMKEFIEEIEGTIADLGVKLNEQEVNGEKDILQRKEWQIEQRLNQKLLELFTGWEAKLKVIKEQIKENL